MSLSRQVVVAGAFDDLRSRDLRFLDEAARLGEVTLLLAPQAPKFPLAERLYFLNALRSVTKVIVADRPPVDLRVDLWADVEENQTRQQYCRERQISYRVFRADELKGFPEQPPTPSPLGRKKIVVTGSYDWFHSGHVRFLEEAGSYGDLYVVVGHDANIRFLKGAGHPLLPEAERRYMVGSIKYVKQALISTGSGWLDADPEICRLRPDIYAVNVDGDKGGKREYCAKLGIEYLLLQRAPAPGLPPRSSTELRGF